MKGTARDRATVPGYGARRPRRRPGHSAACLLVGLAVALSPAAGGEAGAATACRSGDLITVAAVKAEGASRMRGRTVTVSGRVSGIFPGDRGLDGFYLQSREGAEDGLPAGVFVYAPEMKPSDFPPPGEPVQVTASIGSHRGRIQLEWVEAVSRCPGPAPLRPVSLELPVPAERRQRLEDVLVTVPAPLTVTANHELARYGSLDLAVGGRRFHPANGTPSGGRRGIVLDDGSYRGDPRPVPYTDAGGTRRLGSRVAGLTGILTHAFGRHRIHPTEPVRLEPANPRPAAPPQRSGTLRVVSFNLENYFVTPGGRGAASPSELERQRNRITAAVTAMDPDVLALQEVENSPRAVADLVRALNADRPPAARYLAAAASRGMGGQALRMALLYRPARLQPETVWIDRADVHSRPPVAASFRPREGGRPFAVAVVHFKSRTGCPGRGDVDRGQGCWNRLREAQARAVLAFLHRVRAGSGHDRMLLVGDLNSYAEEAPVVALREGGLIDLAAATRLPPARRYSYVYRGRAGYLDYGLASASLAGRVRGFAFWHINADEPPHLGYEHGPSVSGPFRSSDHDPVIIDLRSTKPSGS